MQNRCCLNDHLLGNSFFFGLRCEFFGPFINLCMCSFPFGFGGGTWDLINLSFFKVVITTNFGQRPKSA